jgi:hypothetical protein
MPPRKLTRTTTSPTAPPESPQEVTGLPGPTEVPTVCLPVVIERYRVLFADGDLIDFLATRDTSDTRGQMLDAHYGKRPEKARHNDPTYRIEGIAYLGEEYVHVPEPRRD